MQTQAKQDDDVKYLLALSFIQTIGPVTIKRLLSAFHSPEKIFEAGLGDLTGIGGIRESKARGIKEFRAWDRVEQEIETVRQSGMRLLTYTDIEYPEQLRQIDDSPVILYTKGEIIPEDKYAVAIVGSRNMSPYGRKSAETIAYDLASSGLTIISGMARGIDTAAHKNALKAGGRSIAVLGSGLDMPYPPENTGLYESLSRSGSVISEFPLGTPPNRENFPKRNRLISGLSLGVLVVEATAKSGSLITANYALEQGKDVFAVPGNIASRTSEGTNSLIKRGARLVQKAEDILEELSPVLKVLLRSQGNRPEKSAGRTGALEINDEEKAICNLLDSGTRHIDSISRELRISPSKLSALLLNLEMKGVVKQTEGNNFYIL